MRNIIKNKMSAKRYFYRVHWVDEPEFSGENASSSLWGVERNAPCPFCSGGIREDGWDYDEDKLRRRECPYCDGTGIYQADRGYSCFDDPEELYNYIQDRMLELADDDAQIIIFKGAQVGEGEDGEPLAVPSTHPKERYRSPSWFIRIMKRRIQQ